MAASRSSVEWRVPSLRTVCSLGGETLTCSSSAVGRGTLERFGLRPLAVRRDSRATFFATARACDAELDEPPKGGDSMNRIEGNGPASPQQSGDDRGPYE